MGIPEDVRASGCGGGAGSGRGDGADSDRGCGADSDRGDGVDSGRTRGVDSGRKRVSDCRWLVAAVMALAVSVVVLGFLFAPSPSFTAAPQIPSSYVSGMPTTGDAHVLVLRVSFSDQDPQTAFAEGDTAEALRQLVEGTPQDGAAATEAAYPYEGVAPYYERASYGKLHITGEVFDYQARHARSHYDDLPDALYLEALRALDAQGEDLSRFDANGDGIIDAIYLHFADGGKEIDDWDSPWWSAQWIYEGPDATIDGVRPGALVVLHERANTAAAVRTAIHESGHVLGLPDYYSYAEASELNDELLAEDDAADGDERGGVSGPSADPNAGVIGYSDALDLPLVEVARGSGIQTFDMMQDSLGDHNGFSKWLLGWLDEDQIARVALDDAGATVTVGASSERVAYGDDGTLEIGQTLSALSSASSEGPRVLVASRGDAGPFASYYLVELDAQTGNMAVDYLSRPDAVPAALPDGVRVFRVRAGLNADGSDFTKSAAEGVAGDQLIEAIDPDASITHVETDLTAPVAEGGPYRCLLRAGDSLETNAAADNIVPELTRIAVSSQGGAGNEAVASVTLVFDRSRA